MASKSDSQNHYFETILVIFKLCGFLDILNENYYMVNAVKLFLRVENEPFFCLKKNWKFIWDIFFIFKHCA